MEKLKEEVDELKKAYEEDMEKWRKKYDISEDDEKVKRSSKSKGKKGKKDEDEEETKTEKSKGDKKKDKSA